MKKVLIFSFIVFAFAATATGQTSCKDKKVISPVVPKPTEGSVLSATCSTLNVQWKGAADQTYMANATFYNAATKKWDTTYAAGTCNSSQICTATIPVTAGTNVNWSVQAEQVIAGRTFYSYYFIGKRDYSIPACTLVVTKAASKNNNIKEAPAAKDQLVVYPNPATSEINIKWSGAYTGAAVIAISDATGKEVRVLRILKNKPEYSSRIPLSNLVAGSYYVSIRKQNGPPLSAKFFKE